VKPARSQLLHQLGLYAEQLGRDELDVLTRIAHRLVAGRRIYGPLDIATDRRDWRRERDEEAADYLVYQMVLTIKEGQ